MTAKLSKITKEQQTNILAQYLRNDRLHAGKNIEGHILRQILEGFAVSFLDFRNNLIQLETEMDINKANALLDFYELLVGIPDDCLPIADTIELRRRNILFKFAWLQGNLKKQFEYILNLLGITSFTVQSASESLTLPLTLPFTLFGAEEINYTMVVTLPLSIKPQILPQTLPFTLGSATFDLIQCLFNKLKPAHTQIFYQFFNNTEYTYIPVTDDGYSIITDDGFVLLF